MLSLIVAYAHGRIIGRDGRMPWHIPGELQRFRELTTGNAVIMGRRSYEEIGKPLPGRLNIVLSGTRSYAGENLLCARSLEEAIGLAGNREVYIAGGGRVFEQALPMCDRLYITEVDADIEGDTRFPAFDAQLFSCEAGPWIEAVLPYRYLTYHRLRPCI